MMKTDDDLREILESLIGPDYLSEVQLAVRYGSGFGARDLDLFFVQHGPVPTPGLILGQIDLHVMTQSEFSCRCGLLDPFVPAAAALRKGKPTGDGTPLEPGRASQP